MADKKTASPTKRKAQKDETLLLNVIKSYFKYASAAIAVWGFGYTGFSPAWILLGLVIVVWKEKHNKEQRRRIEISQQAAKNEQEAILARVEDLPSWVSLHIGSYSGNCLSQDLKYFEENVENAILAWVEDLPSWESSHYKR